MIKVLIVEDQSLQQQAYIDSITEFNKSHEIKIDSVIKKSFEEVKELLEYHIFDAAIIDLKLSGSDMEGEGNKIIRSIKNKLRFPIFVVTGYLGELDPDLNDTNIFYRIIERDKIPYKNVLEEISRIYNTGLTKVLGGRGVIEGYLNDIFWNNLTESYETWLSVDNAEKILLRYTLMHIIEYLNRNDSGGFEYYIPEEIYIRPPIDSEMILTGDILHNEVENAYYIVLTPLCDFVNRKAKHVVSCKIEALDRSIIQEIKNLISKGSEVDLNTKHLKNLIRNNYSNKYYFLPKSGKFGGGLINFQKVISHKENDLKAKFKKIATINNQFTKDIIAKFSYYYSRQGSPDLDVEKLYTAILKDS